MGADAYGRRNQGRYLMFGRKRNGDRGPQPEGDHSTGDNRDAVGRPMAVYAGKRPNPHILYGQDDIETGPVTFNRIGTRWRDVQLSNGWQNTNYGKRMTVVPAQYHWESYPIVPGQTRLSGTTNQNFPQLGPAPSQWQNYYQSQAGNQPNYPGGPGSFLGTIANYGHPS